MRRAVFGGTFDPPHNGHLALCLFARELLDLDALIVSVSKNPLKDGADASDEERIAMTRLLVDEVNCAGKFAETSSWEMRQSGPSYTIDLLRYLKGQYGDDELILLVGEDSYRQMPQWKEYRQIPELCDIAVFGRSDGELVSEVCGEPLPPARLFDFNLPVSATAIRRLLASGHPASRLVPPSIASYIEARHLYRRDDSITVTSTPAPKCQES